MMKGYFLDIIIILILAVALTVLAETGNMDSLIKFPFMTIYLAYGLGRFAGYLSNRKQAGHQKKTPPKKK